MWVYTCVQGDRQTNQTSFPGSDLHVVPTDVGDGDHLLLHLLRLGVHQLLRARGWVQVLRHGGQGAGRGEKITLLFFFLTLIITIFKSLLVIYISSQAKFLDFQVQSVDPALLSNFNGTNDEDHGDPGGPEEWEQT